MRASRLAVVCLFASTVAWAEAPTYSEGEGIEVGAKALREGRFDDAIAAFAQSDKASPGIHYGQAETDPRSSLIARSLLDCIQELDARGAPPSEKLRYWQFYADNYPFFSVMRMPLSDDSWQEAEFHNCFTSAAQERCRQADPEGTSARSRWCERVAELCRAEDADALLACLENDWTDAHDDFGLCAARVSTVIQTRVQADRAVRQEWVSRSAAWHAYLDRIPDSAFLGQAACGWGDPEQALAIATDPRARRRCRLGMVGWGDDTATLMALGAESGPWVSEALGWAWAVSDLAVGHESGDRERARELLEEMKGRFPGRTELGMARFAIYWFDSNGHVGESVLAEIRAWLGQWEEAAPDDPYLAWARMEEVWRRRLLGEDLDPEDRRLLEGLIETYPADALGAMAKMLLAEDDLRRGDGKLALKRFEEVAAFDVRGVRLRGPRHAHRATEWAAGRLERYYEIRDVSRVFDLMAPTEMLIGRLHRDGGCATGYEDPLGLDNLSRSYRRWSRPEHIEKALDEAEAELRNREMWPPPVREFVEACLRAGAEDRLERVDSSLESLEGLGQIAPSVRDDIRALLEDRATIVRDGPSAAVGLVHDLVGEKIEAGHFFEGHGPLRALGILAILQSLRGVDAALASHRDHPASALAVLLASAGDTEDSIQYLIETCIDRRAEVPGEVVGLAEEALAERGEPAARALYRRMARTPTEDHSLERSALARFDGGAMWRACVWVRDDEHLALPAWVQEEIERVAREDPWAGFALAPKR
ncbi:MAG: hypothetical protein AAB434_08710 [Planctomycetota bacterium]